MRYRWIVLAVGVAGTLVTGALRQGLPALGPAFRDTFDLSLAEVGLIFAALTAGVTIALVPWGWLADKVGERFVLAGGLVGTALALALAGSADSYAALLAGLFVTGVFGASATGASGRAVMGWFGRSERGLALGIRQTAIPLGGAMAALSLPPIAIAAGLLEALLALAAFATVAAVVAVVWMREPPPPPADRPVVQAPVPSRDPRIWRLGVGSGLFVIAQAVLIAFTVLFLESERGMSVAAAAAVLATLQLGAAVTRIAIGVRSDRVERRIVPMRHVGLVGAVLMGALAVAADAPLAVLLPLLVAAGVVTSSWNGLAFTAAAEMAGRARAGTAMGLQNTLVSVIGVGASPLFGILVEATSWRVGFAVFALAPLAGWWVLRPLEGEEDRRAAAREQRQASYAVGS